MSEPIDSKSIDDRTFEEYLGRESQLSKRYRALGADEVPAELDRRVLTQAQQALAVKPAGARKKPAWMRWTPPLALAASMVLVISIVIESGTQHEVTMRDVAATPPPSAPVQTAATVSNDMAKQESPALSEERQQLSALEPEESVAAPAPKARQMQVRKKADAALRRDPVTVELKQSVIPPAFVASAPAETQLQSAAVAADMPSPATKIEVPPPAPIPAVVTAANIGNAEMRRSEAVTIEENDDLAEISVTGTRVRAVGGAGQGAGPRGTVTAPTAGNLEATREALLQQVREGDPQLWLEYIRELRRENKGGAADREWRSFIKAYPDYKVDEKDVARARQ